MLAGLASPSHLILVLVLILLLFGAKRIPELAKGLGAGLQELREGISTDDPKTETSTSEGVRGAAGAGDETTRATAGRRKG